MALAGTLNAATVATAATTKNPNTVRDPAAPLVRRPRLLKNVQPPPGFKLNLRVASNASHTNFNSAALGLWASFTLPTVHS